ncbi:divergent PAP2 family protein [uncultured Prochlorococcus sp.]|uniref:divergent PAP2 family protein n=1 Tax=uncultured Prochlorococcus sp. TaxID=159733 RepID=UPI00258CB153|nr:divergent PAP2 family protein [uncultured Prochlorococcus sp.]
MSEFSAFFNNSILFWSLLSCLLAQFLKIIFNFFSTGKMNFRIMFETGGMPSSHSALITGATSGIGFELGFDSSIFALAVAIALIVMYDASGVRKSAGIQAAEINKLSKKLEPKSEVILKETLGHTKFEVIVGSFLGPLITLPGMFFLGSPLKIFNLIIN